MAKASLFEHFSSLPDPRLDRQKKHQLPDILFITICAVLSGADNWVMIEEFGKSKEDWFTDTLKLQNGIPSHDTFGYVFSALDINLFSQCFTQWVADLASLSSGEVVAIDGKTVRRSLDRASGKAAIHMVSAWAQANRLVLGQEKVSEKSNEITAIPKLLARLDIIGAVVTLDAMGCQKVISKQIIEQQGDYVFSLKGNHGELHDDVRRYFASQPELDCSTHVDSGHGRIETRTVRVGREIEWLKERHPEWTSLNSIVAVTARRETKQRTEEDTRYFISSLPHHSAERMGQVIRYHWAVENNLHWVLDVAFDEDQNRARTGNSAANLSMVRQIALNLLKQDKSTKVGIKTKRAKARWDNSYLLKLLRI